LDVEQQLAINSKNYFLPHLSQKNFKTFDWTMDLQNLPTFYKLCPNITNIKLEYSNKDFHCLKFLNNFKNLKSIEFVGLMELSHFIEFLHILEENNLERIQFPDFNFENHEQILEFHQILFQKTNLKEFQGIHFNHKDETKSISCYFEKNSSLKKLDLNCNSLKNLNPKYIPKFLNHLLLKCWMLYREIAPLRN
jgi:hypothetical protein